MSETPTALHNLYKFLSYRVVHVLDVVNRRHRAYRVDVDAPKINKDDLSSNGLDADDGQDDDEDERRYLTVSQLRDLIDRDTGIPPSQQVNAVPIGCRLQGSVVFWALLGSQDCMI